MKYFIITIDTEGDNLWRWCPGNPITTRNVKYLKRFQNLCEKYGFKPVWLSNYEMICNDEYVDFIKTVENSSNGELGLHLHAWNNPPIVDLPKSFSGLPYLIEYDNQTMRDKFRFLNDLIVERTGISPVSHRAGRWAMDRRYFDLLKDFDYKVDCSVTPHMNWNIAPGQSVDGGSDYSSYPEDPYWIDGEKTLLEVPVTVRLSHGLYLPDRLSVRGIAKSLYCSFKGEELWLRPNGNNERQLMHLIDSIALSDSDYIMFMLHSSEFMPGGSPTFPDEKSIENLYGTLTRVFDRASKCFKGITLRDYYKKQNTLV